MSQAKYHQFKKMLYLHVYSVEGWSVHANYSGVCDLSAKVIILLFAHATKKQKSLKELYGELIITI